MIKSFSLKSAPIFLLVLLSYQIGAQPIFKHSPKGIKLPPQAGAEIDVINYGIALELMPADRLIVGRTTIDFASKTNFIQELQLDFIGLKVDSAFQKKQKISYLQDARTINLNLQSSLAINDTTRVTIHYHGNPIGGVYFRPNRYGQEVIYSHSEPYDARYWFPCKDDPSDKAQLELQVTLPAAYTVLSNGTLIEDKMIAEDKRTLIWQEEYPIATYLISLAAAPYEIVDARFDYQDKQMPVLYYAYPEDAQQAQETLPGTIQMLRFFSDYIGCYPFIGEKYAMSEVPFREAGAMENQTATTMSESRFDDESVIAHELAHQWWGDAVTPASFIDIWLNEGFATYFDALFTEYKYGRESFENRMLQNASNINTDGSLAYPIYNPPERYLFGASVYLKGAWVLHMLRYEVGDELFRQIVQRYYQNYNYQNVTTADFIHLVEQISGSSWQRFFNQWLYYGGIPILHGSWSQQKESLEIFITQTQPEPIYQFNLELLLKYAGSDTLITLPLFQQSHRLTLPISSPLLEIVIDPDHKILNSNNGPVHQIPTTSKLLNSYPNPFNSIVHFVFQLHRTQKISLEIYNLGGQKVATVYQGRGLAGFNDLSWQSSDQASGIYFCQLNYEGGRDIIKIMLVK